MSIAHELSLNERLEGIGGPAYLSHLVQVVPTSVHVEHYARIVQRTSVMRQIIHAGGEIASIGYEAGPDADAALRRAEEAIFRVRSGRGARDFTHIRDVLDSYMEQSAAMQTSADDHLAPVATGFADLDKLLGGGLHRSDLIVLAARPSIGKSTPRLQHRAARRRHRQHRGGLQPGDGERADRPPPARRRGRSRQPQAAPGTE